MTTPAKQHFDWAAFWDNKAAQPTDFQATGRSVMSEVDFQHAVQEVVRLLAIVPQDILVDIGCGSGLFCLALASQVSGIDAIDISPAMVERARRNTANLTNVMVTVGGFPRLDLVSEAYTKLLGYSVLQYLPDEATVSVALSESARLLKQGGRGLFSCNPDPSRRASYLDIVRQNSSSAEFSRSLQIIEQTLWIEPARLATLANQAGLRAYALPISERIWQHFYMFDLLVEKP